MLFKVDKMLKGDREAQAAIRDCFNSMELIRGAAGEIGAGSSLMDVCGGLYRKGCGGGVVWGGYDCCYEDYWEG